MATFNESHHESGGVVLFNGEYILLFCDNVKIKLQSTNQSVSFELVWAMMSVLFIAGNWSSLFDYTSYGVYGKIYEKLIEIVFGSILLHVWSVSGTTYFRCELHQGKSQRSSDTKSSCVWNQVLQRWSYWIWTSFEKCRSSDSNSSQWGTIPTATCVHSIRYAVLSGINLVSFSPFTNCLF